MQNTYAQNKEDLFVLNYFGDYKGTLLEIGANDGTTLSNSRLLIENGWNAYLFEPGETFKSLRELYRNNTKASYFQFGIGDKNEIVKFWNSGAHVPGGSDKGLVSTTNFEETKRWPNVKFTESGIQLLPFTEACKIMNRDKFDFISIDAEGSDLSILKQIDLEAVGCKCLCIEYNSNPDLLKLFSDYCAGYKLELINGENLVFCK